MNSISYVSALIPRLRVTIIVTSQKLLSREVSITTHSFDNTDHKIIINIIMINYYRAKKCKKYISKLICFCFPCPNIIVPND